MGRDQVMVRVTIAEVRRTIMKQLGITNALAQGNWGSIALNNPLTNQLTNGGINIGAAALPTATAAGINGLSAQLQAYERNGAARILAEPTVTAVSGENAKFTAGGEIPVPAGETCANGACSTGVTFKPYGVSLNFAPVVLSDGKILMRIATEVTEMDPSVTFSFNSTSVSGFRTRKNEATIELPSGGSIATAGLIQTTSQATLNGLPGLMNLPVLGALFRSRDYQRQETELVIIVTPYIAKSVSKNELAVPGQNIIDATDAQALLLGTMNRIYAPNPDQANLARYRGPVGFIND
jgi:pilus assembly protein CpaC